MIISSVQQFNFIIKNNHFMFTFKCIFFCHIKYYIILISLIIYKIQKLIIIIIFRI